MPVTLRANRTLELLASFASPAKPHSSALHRTDASTPSNSSYSLLKSQDAPSKPVETHSMQQSDADWMKSNTPSTLRKETPSDGLHLLDDLEALLLAHLGKEESPKNSREGVSSFTSFV